MKRELHVGPVGIGGPHPVSIQSMTKTRTGNASATLRQIEALAVAGCQIVRVSLPDASSLPAFRRIVGRSPLPVIADVHFDGRLALAAIEAGAQGLRVNPGNIGSNRLLKEIVAAAGARGLPLRIGANSGSLPKSIAAQSRLSPAEKLVAAVLERCKFLEDQGFTQIKVSVKSSSVRETVAAYRLIDRQCDYPLHLGVTEAGLGLPGIVKSAVGIGSLLLDGIGNTIRVSLTAPPTEEVAAAKEILYSLDLLRGGIEIVSCPTCSRTSVDLRSKVRQLQRALRGSSFPRRVKVAVMGCEVNGPGEAAEADLGLAFSRGRGYLFRRGREMEPVEEKRAIALLVERILERSREEKGGGTPPLRGHK